MNGNIRIILNGRILRLFSVILSLLAVPAISYSAVDPDGCAVTVNSRINARSLYGDHWSDTAITQADCVELCIKNVRCTAVDFDKSTTEWKGCWIHTSALGQLYDGGGYVDLYQVQRNCATSAAVTSTIQITTTTPATTTQLPSSTTTTQTQTIPRVTELMSEISTNQKGDGSTKIETTGATEAVSTVTNTNNDGRSTTKIDKYSDESSTTKLNQESSSISKKSEEGSSVTMRNQAGSAVTKTNEITSVTTTDLDFTAATQKNQGSTNSQKDPDVTTSAQKGPDFTTDILGTATNTPQQDKTSAPGFTTNTQAEQYITTNAPGDTTNTQKEQDLSGTTSNNQEVITSTQKQEYTATRKAGQEDTATTPKENEVTATSKATKDDTVPTNGNKFDFTTPLDDQINSKSSIIKDQEASATTQRYLDSSATATPRKGEEVSITTMKSEELTTNQGENTKDGDKTTPASQKDPESAATGVITTSKASDGKATTVAQGETSMITGDDHRSETKDPVTKTVTTKEISSATDDDEISTGNGQTSPQVSTAVNRVDDSTVTPTNQQGVTTKKIEEKTVNAFVTTTDNDVSGIASNIVDSTFSVPRMTSIEQIKTTSLANGNSEATGTNQAQATTAKFVNVFNFTTGNDGTSENTEVTKMTVNQGLESTTGVRVISTEGNNKETSSSGSTTIPTGPITTPEGPTISPNGPTITSNSDATTAAISISSTTVVTSSASTPNIVTTSPSTARYYNGCQITLVNLTYTCALDGEHQGTRGMTVDSCVELCITNIQCTAVEFDRSETDSKGCWMHKDVSAWTDIYDGGDYVDQYQVYRSCPSSTTTVEATTMTTNKPTTEHLTTVSFSPQPISSTTAEPQTSKIDTSEGTPGKNIFETTARPGPMATTAVSGPSTTSGPATQATTGKLATELATSTEKYPQSATKEENTSESNNLTSPETSAAQLGEGSTTKVRNGEGSAISSSNANGESATTRKEMEPTTIITQTAEDVVGTKEIIATDPTTARTTLKSATTAVNSVDITSERISMEQTSSVKVDDRATALSNAETTSIRAETSPNVNTFKIDPDTTAAIKLQTSQSQPGDPTGSIKSTNTIQAISAISTEVKASEAPSTASTHSRIATDDGNLISISTHVNAEVSSEVVTSRIIPVDVETSTAIKPATTEDGQTTGTNTVATTDVKTVGQSESTSRLSTTPTLTTVEVTSAFTGRTFNGCQITLINLTYTCALDGEHQGTLGMTVDSCVELCITNTQCTAVEFDRSETENKGCWMHKVASAWTDLYDGGDYVDQYQVHRSCPSNATTPRPATTTGSTQMAITTTHGETTTAARPAETKVNTTINGETSIPQTSAMTTKEPSTAIHTETIKAGLESSKPDLSSTSSVQPTSLVSSNNAATIGGTTGSKISDATILGNISAQPITTQPNGGTAGFRISEATSLGGETAGLPTTTGGSKFSESSVSGGEISRSLATATGLPNIVQTGASNDGFSGSSEASKNAEVGTTLPPISAETTTGGSNTVVPNTGSTGFDLDWYLNQTWPENFTLPENFTFPPNSATAVISSFPHQIGLMTILTLILTALSTLRRFD